MRVLFFLIATTLIATADVAVSQTGGNAAATDPASQSDFEARFREAENYRQALGVDLDIMRSLRIHQELAEAGFGRSLHRMGDFHYYGLAVPQDFAKAAAFYGRAAAAGNTPSLIRQAQALRALGAGPESLAVIERAIDLNLDGALEERSAGHLFGEYGKNSDVAFGFAETQRLARDIRNQVANYQLAEAYRRGVGTPVNEAEAFRLYSMLRDQGHAAAMERLADFYAQGRAVARNPETAIELYRTAASLGREGAYVPMSKLLSEMGRGSDALLAMQQGVASGDEEAKIEMAVGHLDGAFGTESDPERGRMELNSLAEGGNLRAAATVLDRIGKGDDLKPNLGLVIGQLETAMQNGDGRAAESLLTFYREVPDAVDGSLDRRKAILDNYGPIIRGRIYYPELANLAYDENDGSDAYPMLLEIVRKADSVGLERALLQIFWRDKNAFTYILQAEFKERGLYSGGVNGYLNRTTVRSILRYCQEKNFYDVCLHGPLRTPAVRLIAASLRHDREVASGSNAPEQ